MTLRSYAHSIIQPGEIYLPGLLIWNSPGPRGIGLNGSGAFQRAFSYPEQGSSYYLRQCKVLSPSSGGKRPSRLSDPYQG